MLFPSLLFILGLIMMIFFGDRFVNAAIALANKTGIPKMIIGATIVSIATTLPEFTVSIMATAAGSPQIAIGNALGSVICNTGLIVSLTLMIHPQKITKDFKSKGIILLTAIIYCMFVTLDGRMTAFETIPLYCICALFFYLNIKDSKVSMAEFKEENKGKPADTGNVLLIGFNFIISIIGIVIGAQLLITNGTLLAQSLGIPESVIALTMIALGTSLPELTTTISALVKKEYSLSIGNILGANILNIVLIISTCSLIAPSGLPMTDQIIRGTAYSVNLTQLIDFPIALLLSSLFVLPAIACKRTKRWQGFVITAIYILYIIFLFTYIK